MYGETSPQGNPEKPSGPPSDEQVLGLAAKSLARHTNPRPPEPDETPEAIAHQLQPDYADEVEAEQYGPLGDIEEEQRRIQEETARKPQE